MVINKNPNIIIVGGGAGGLELAAKLGKKLGKKNKANITLIDSSPIHIWKPILHEVAAGTLNSYEDKVDYFSYASNRYFQFCLGTFIGLDRTKKQIILAPLTKGKQEIIPTRTISYDILILAIGSITNDFGISGVREHCLFLDSLTQAENFHTNLVENILRLSYEKKQHMSSKFSMMIIGGGATGIELAAELKYAIGQMRHCSLDLDPSMIDITIIEAAPRLLPILPPTIVDEITQKLLNLGVNVLTNQRITAVNEEGVTVDGKLLPADKIIWTAGVKADNLLSQLDGLETNKINQLLVKKTLQTTQDDVIFAFGDCASCPQPGKDSKVPPRAQAAHQQASLLVTSMMHILEKKSLPTYRYRDYGSLISLSKYQTFGNLIGAFSKNIFIQGIMARFMYRSLYKMHQIALYGFWRVMLLSIANTLSGPTRGRLKLH